MIQTGSVNDVKTGINVGAAQVLEGFKVTPASNDAANNILANKRLNADKAEKKAKEEQDLYKRLNFDLKGTRTQDVPQIRALAADTLLKMQQDSAAGKLNMNSPEYQQRFDAIADGINASIKAETTAQNYEKEQNKEGLLAGKYELTPTSKKDYQGLRSDNATPVGAENYDKWLEEVNGKTGSLQASGVPQMVFPEMDFHNALASNATSYKNNHTNKIEITDPNDPSKTIIIERESYNPKTTIEGAFDAPTPKGLAMKRLYTGMLSNNEELAKQYKFNPAPETKEQEMKNLEAAKQLAVDRGMKIGSVNVNKQESQGGRDNKENFKITHLGNGITQIGDYTATTKNPVKPNEVPENYANKFGDAVKIYEEQVKKDPLKQDDFAKYLLNNAISTTITNTKKDKTMPEQSMVDVAGKTVEVKPKTFITAPNGDEYMIGFKKYKDSNGVNREKYYVFPYNKGDNNNTVKGVLGTEIRDIQKAHAKELGENSGQKSTQSTTNENTQTKQSLPTITGSQVEEGFKHFNEKSKVKIEKKEYIEKYVTPKFTIKD